MAQAQVDEARKLSEDVNKKLAETKVEEIQRMAEYAAFREDNEEPELHEAYLREDWDLFYYLRNEMLKLVPISLTTQVII